MTSVFVKMLSNKENDIRNKVDIIKCHNVGKNTATLGIKSMMEKRLDFGNHHGNRCLCAFYSCIIVSKCMMQVALQICPFSV